MENTQPVENLFGYLLLHFECRFNKNSLLRSYFLVFFAGFQWMDEWDLNNTLILDSLWNSIKTSHDFYKYGVYISLIWNNIL